MGQVCARLASERHFRKACFGYRIFRKAVYRLRKRHPLLRWIKSCCWKQTWLLFVAVCTFFRQRCLSDRRHGNGTTVCRLRIRRKWSAGSLELLYQHAARRQQIDERGALLPSRPLPIFSVLHFTNSSQNDHARRNYPHRISLEEKIAVCSLWHERKLTKGAFHYDKCIWYGKIEGAYRLRGSRLLSDHQSGPCLPGLYVCLWWQYHLRKHLSLPLL